MAPYRLRACLRFFTFAFELAVKHGRKTVHCVHKANILKLADGLFLDCFQRVAKNYHGIAAKDLIVDNACMQLVSKPGQFEVVAARMETEFSSPVRLDRLDYTLALRTTAAAVEALAGLRGAEVLQRSDGTHLALFADRWRARSIILRRSAKQQRCVTAAMRSSIAASQ